MQTVYNWFNKPTHKPPTTPANTSDLSEVDKLCYDKIVRDTLRHFADISEKMQKNTKVGETHSFYALIFRQSLSWEQVTTLCDQILDGDENQVVKAYAKGWKTRVQELEKLNNTIKELEIALKTPSSNQEKQENKKEISLARELIRLKLASGSASLKIDENLPVLKSPIKKSALCTQLVKHLKNNWDCLILFSEWNDVSMDDSRMHVQVRRPKSNNGNTQMELPLTLDSSTKALFLLRSIVQNDGYLYETVDQRFAQEKGRSSSNIITEIIFDYDYVGTPKNQEKAKVTQKQIETIVYLALHQINYKLSIKNKLTNLKPESYSLNFLKPLFY